MSIMIGKTIKSFDSKSIKYHKDYNWLETKGYVIEFTDGTSVELAALIKESPSSYWDDEPELYINFKDKENE